MKKGLKITLIILLVILVLYAVYFFTFRYAYDVGWKDSFSYDAVSCINYLCQLDSMDNNFTYNCLINESAPFDMPKINISNIPYLEFQSEYSSRISCARIFFNESVVNQLMSYYNTSAAYQ